MHNLKDFYSDTWKGSFDGSAEDLDILLDRSADVVNNAIVNSGYTVDTVPLIWQTRVYKAVCAHADYINSNGGIDSLTENSFSSASLSKFSYSVNDSGNKDNGAVTLCPLATGYLAPTGLLYNGVTVI